MVTAMVAMAAVEVGGSTENNSGALKMPMKFRTWQRKQSRTKKKERIQWVVARAIRKEKNKKKKSAQRKS